MSRPNDDELERVAKDCALAAQVMQATGTFETGQSILDQAAAMLRACKGRGADYLVEFDNGDSVSLSSMSGGASPEGVMGSISLMKETEAGETMFRRYKAVTDWTSGLWDSPAPEPAPPNFKKGPDHD